MSNPAETLDYFPARGPSAAGGRFFGVRLTSPDRSASLTGVSMPKHFLDPAIADYADRCTSKGDPLYARLVEETEASTLVPAMQLGRLEGRLLTLLVRISGARRAIELGTFTGYSALSIAEGLPEEGRLTTCDIDERTTEIARRYFAEAPWGHKIELRLAPALETLAAMDGPFDFAFIDADKERYVEYWEALLPKMSPGSLLVVDNVLWSGAVLEPKTRGAKAVAAFNQHIGRDPRVETVLLTVRDGLTLARKLPEPRPAGSAQKS
jgi:caffeoyl-CoA O-methyltransferase